MDNVRHLAALAIFTWTLSLGSVAAAESSPLSPAWIVQAQTDSPPCSVDTNDVNGTTISYTVQPNGATVDTWLIWDKADPNNSPSPQRVLVASGLSGKNPINVRGVLTGLSPSTTYYFQVRLVSGTTTYKTPGIQSFTTPPQAAVLKMEVANIANSGQPKRLAIRATVDTFGVPIQKWSLAWQVGTMALKTVQAQFVQKPAQPTQYDVTQPIEETPAAGTSISVTSETTTAGGLVKKWGVIVSP